MLGLPASLSYAVDVGDNTGCREPPQRAIGTQGTDRITSYSSLPKACAQRTE